VPSPGPVPPQGEPGDGSGPPGSPARRLPARSGSTEAAGPPSNEPGQDRVLTVPNLISFGRLLLVPVFAVLIGQGRDVAAFTVLVVAGISDWADGKIARRFHQTSSLGRALDPAADRLFIAVALVGLAIRGSLPWWLVVVIVLREVSIAAVLPALLARGYGPLPVHLAGKTGTAMLMYALPLLLLAGLSNAVGQVAWAVGWAAALWGAVLYWFAGALYLVQAGGIIRAAPRIAR
jgi:cardiolipin synthase